MSYVLDFLKEYGFTIIYAVLTAIAAFIGKQIKNVYQNRVDDKTKREIVETCVMAVEQLYQQLSGSEKLERAKESIVEILETKGISISTLELDMLIESVVAEFNLYDLKIEKNNSQNSDELIETPLG